ncbi:MAG: hypothetical protein KAW87_02290 [Candidatus Cloacimonetes bacterium]|nr:hypothetical protein [Candidatus Cloacimonadota bacterium]
MKKKTFFVFVVLLFICFTEICNAQEIQIPIDEEGKIEYIDSKLEQKLGLFAEYSKFREARLFQISDTSFVLEIFYQPQEKLLKVRLPFSLEDTKNFQRKVTERIKQKEPQVVINQEGRTKLIVGTMGLSLGYYGWAVPVALEVDDVKLAVALYMFTSSAGFYIPLSVTRNIPVTDAAATLSLYGGRCGIVHGISLANLLSREPSGQGLSASGMLVSIVETLAGFNIANRLNISAGTAETICVGGDFGIGLGLGMAHLANFFGDDKGQAVAGSILLGSGVGLFWGKLLADHQPYTRGDAHVLSATGLLGAYIPLAAVDISGTKNEKAYTAASMLGAVVGLGLGHNLVQGKDFTTSQGNLIRLSELAGGLLGLGVAYLISSEDEDSSVLYLTLSSIGAAGGFWLMYRSYAQSARTSNKGSSWNINIRPEGLLAFAMGKIISSAKETPLPLLTFDFRF